jgi:hypothetical protein
MSGDDRAHLEDIQVSHCATSSLYQYTYTEQNACQFHHSHGAMQVGDTPRTVMMCGRACRTAAHRTPHIDMLLTIVLCRGPSPHNHHGTGGRTRGRRPGHHDHSQHGGDFGTACAGLAGLAGFFPDGLPLCPPLGAGVQGGAKGGGKPGTLNLSEFVARKHWPRSWQPPRHCSAHHVQKGAHLGCGRVPMDTNLNLLQTARN